MPVDQGHGAPFRQQRYIEIENVGASEIPAYGIVEITDSYRPEKGAAGYTPDGGATVLKVEVATTDSPCAWIINGHCPIPVGQRGRVGTMDFPTMAIFYEAPTSVGQAHGIQAGSYYLHQDGCGLVYVGDYDPVTTMGRVIRRDDCQPEEFVKATECHKLGESGEAQPQKFNSTTCAWEDDTNKSPVTVIDPECWRVALIGEKYWVHKPGAGCGGSSGCGYIPKSPFGLMRKVKITTEIPCGASDDVLVMENTAGECDWPETTCEVKACNTSNRKIACDADEEATWMAVPGECSGWLIPRARATKARANLTSGMCGDTAAFEDISYLDVCDWTPRDEPTSAANPLGLYGCDTDAIDLEWNDLTCSWEVANVAVHYFQGPGPVMEIGCGSGCELIYSRVQGGMAIQQCESCETITYAEIPTTEVTVVGAAGYYDNGAGICRFQVGYHKICVLGCDTQDAPQPLIQPMTAVPVLTDAYLGESGLCITLEKLYGTVYVPCVSSEATYDTDEVCGTDCEEPALEPVVTMDGLSTVTDMAANQITTQ